MATRAAPPVPDLVEHVCDHIHSVRKARPALRHVSIEVTGRCNLRCRHCYFGEPTGAELSLAELLGLALEIRRDFGRKTCVCLTGGEPLLRPDLLPLLRFLHLLEFRPALASNGTLLDPTTVWRMAPFVDTLSVSLDGMPASHALLRGPVPWRRVVEGIRQAVLSPIRCVEVKTAVWRGNIRDLPALFGLVRLLGASSWHIFPAEPLGRGAAFRPFLLTPDDHAALCRFYDRIKEETRFDVRFGEHPTFYRRWPTSRAARYLRCDAGISALSVLADGSVVACMQERGEPEGNVRRERLLDIWRRGFRRQRSKCWRTCGAHARFCSAGDSVVGLSRGRATEMR